jgi:uncharacterized protein (TIGR03382 family)
LLDGDRMTIKHVLAFGLLAVPACAVDVGHGTSSQSIVGGQVVMPSEFPTVVALEDSPSNWFCTGTLITDSWVLTAAHCVDGAMAMPSVRFDDADVNDTTGGIVAAVAEVHEHPGFDWNLWDNDVALLKLAQPVTDRTPTPLLREAVAFGTNVIDVGYGVADNNDGGGGILRKLAKVTADCAGAGDPGVSSDNLVCMDASDGAGSCFGDSGGPTFATVDNKLVVAGVTSGGTGELCGAGWDLYTSVHAELEFIDSVLNAVPTPPDPDPQPDPDPDPNPDPDPPGGMHHDDGGGCNAGGGSGAFVAFALAGLLARRRRM